MGIERNVTIKRHEILNFRLNVRSLDGSIKLQLKILNLNLRIYRPSYG